MGEIFRTLPGFTHAALCAGRHEHGFAENGNGAQRTRYRHVERGLVGVANNLSFLCEFVKSGSESNISLYIAQLSEFVTFVY